MFFVLVKPRTNILVYELIWGRLLGFGCCLRAVEICICVCVLVRAQAWNVARNELKELKLQKLHGDFAIWILSTVAAEEVEQKPWHLSFILWVCCYTVITFVAHHLLQDHTWGSLSLAMSHSLLWAYVCVCTHVRVSKFCTFFSAWLCVWVGFDWQRNRSVGEWHFSTLDITFQHLQGAVKEIGLFETKFQWWGNF